MYPIVGLLWVFFGCIRIVVPPIQKILLWIAELFNRIYEKINNQYRLWLPSILRRPSTVIALVVFAVLGSGWLGNSLGATLLPEMKQGRFSVDVRFQSGLRCRKQPQTSLNLEGQLQSIDGIDHVYAIVGADSRVNARSGAGEHSIRYLISTTADEDQVISTRGVSSIRWHKTLGKLEYPDRQSSLSITHSNSSCTPKI